LDSRRATHYGSDNRALSAEMVFVVSRRITRVRALRVDSEQTLTWLDFAEGSPFFIVICKFNGILWVLLVGTDIERSDIF
jgi:hypothetical protein